MKRLRCICDNPWAFFDLSSVAVGSQSAMQQYYLPTIYIIWRWTGISLAIIRPVSLRLQNEGQKKLTDCTDAHGVFDTDFFWPLFFDLYLDSIRICKRNRLRLLWFRLSCDMLQYCINTLLKGKQVPTHLQNPSKIPFVLLRHNQNQKKIKI